MKTKYHIEITRKALARYFSEDALLEIIHGNTRQDRIRNQFGHDYIHFDGSAFKAGFEYLEKQKLSVINSIRNKDYHSARRALGRVTHSWQDYYSHSNYVRLWVSNHVNLPPELIVVDDLTIMNHPDLKSGKNYGMIEFLALIPGLSTWIKPRMPKDSHAVMNLDGPETGELFNYAYQAAIKRTSQIFDYFQAEMERQGFSRAQRNAFLGK